ncbi:MAG: glutaredoxin domain-containing protein [Cyanobacteria bacterium P01_E01_bin.35]
MGKIIIFFKESCGHCQRAKTLLSSKQIPYEAIDITNDEYQRLLMIHLSDRQTVPQIFFNEQHIGGAKELLALEDQQVLDDKLREVFAATTPPNFPPQNISEQMLAETELPLSQVLDNYTVDITKVHQFEPIIPVFQQQFGFMPHTFKYVAIWDKAFMTWSCAHLTMWRNASNILSDFLTVAGFATSNAAECSYCAAHATQLSIDKGIKSDRILKLYEFYRLPNPGDDSILPFTPFERSLIRLARGATLNQVTSEEINEAYRLNPEKAPLAITGVAAITACYGFLNRFNDLIGTEIEGKIEGTAMKELGEHWEMGKHETQDNSDAELSFNSPFSSVKDRLNLQSLESYLENNVASVGNDVNTYLQKQLGLLPRWIQQIPFEDAQRATARFYVAMTENSQISAELKHLMNLVVTQANGHSYLANLERFLVHRAAKAKGMNTKTSLERIASCLDVARGKDSYHKYFDHRDAVALKLALASASFPPFTPYSLVKSLQRCFTPRQIVELVMSLTVCGFAQRWTAVIKPDLIEPEVAEFLGTYTAIAR